MEDEEEEWQQQVQGQWEGQQQGQQFSYGCHTRVIEVLLHC